MGFGFAALLTSPIAQALIKAVGIVKTFYILGLVYFIVMIISAQFIKRPNENEIPKVENAKTNDQINVP